MDCKDQDSKESSSSSSSSSSDSDKSNPYDVDRDIVITVPGAILHLIDKQFSVELAWRDFSVTWLMQGDNSVADLARVAGDIQWPLMRDQAAVKLEDSHYFFSIGTSSQEDDDDDIIFLNYGLTFALKGQEDVLENLDRVLESYTSFTIQKVDKKGGGEEVLDGSVANELSPSDLEVDKTKQVMEKTCQAYWTTLAPNVEDYTSIAAKLVAAGSGQLVKGILWCGDVTADRMKWGNEIMKKKMAPGNSATEISPETLKRIKRVRRVSKMTAKVAVGVLSGVLIVSGFFTSSAANSKVGKRALWSPAWRDGPCFSGWI